MPPQGAARTRIVNVLHHPTGNQRQDEAVTLQNVVFR